MGIFGKSKSERLKEAAAYLKSAPDRDFNNTVIISGLAWKWATIAERNIRDGWDLVYKNYCDMLRAEIDLRKQRALDQGKRFPPSEEAAFQENLLEEQQRTKAENDRIKKIVDQRIEELRQQNLISVTPAKRRKR